LLVCVVPEEQSNPKFYSLYVPVASGAKTTHDADELHLYTTIGPLFSHRKTY
jgi:hypothetical protein